MVKKLLIGATVLLGTMKVGAAFAAVTGLPDFTGLVETAGPAVVNIKVTQYGQRAPAGPGDGPDQQIPQEQIPEMFRRFFDFRGQPGYDEPDRNGAGSGFIVESNGYIITNHHVIDGADQVIVRLADRREFEATLVGSDPASDIALLKVEADNLPTLKIGSSAALKSGQWVAAIGSPFNFEQTITAGIVSAKGRSNGAQQYVPFIQTDVAINRGNSGGPLLDLNGEVVGINSWILSGSGGYIGLSFSIPIETAMNAVDQLRKFGKVSRGLLGVVVGPVTREMAEAMNLSRPVGALVNDVSPEGSAGKAGIKPGDIILAFDDMPIETSGDLPPIVGANPPGTTAEVLVSRDGKEMTFDVTLDALEPGSGEQALASEGTAQQSNAIGLAVETLGADQRQALGDPKGGVLITKVESDAAYRVGLRPGDVILMINNQPVSGVDGFEKIVKGIKPGKAIALRVFRDGVSNFIAYTPSAIE